MRTDKSRLAPSPSGALKPGATPVFLRAFTRHIAGQETVLVAVIAALWIGLALTSDTFLTVGSLRPLFLAVAPVAVIGIGMTLVISTGGIDISVGAAMLLTSALVAQVMVNSDIPVALVVLLAILIGGLLGTLNGILTAYGRVHPIIITFGTSNLFLFGAVQVIGSDITGIPSITAFSSAAEGRFLGMPITFLVAATLAGVAAWALHNRPTGRHILAIGGNPEAARLVGIRVAPVTVLVYVATGLLVGLAATFSLGLGTSSLTTSEGFGVELAVIAAVVIGGTSILGGRGSILGTLLGAVLVQTVAAGNTHLGLPSSLSNLFAGVMILIALAIEQLRRSRERRHVNF